MFRNENNLADTTEQKELKKVELIKVFVHDDFSSANVIILFTINKCVDLTTD